MITLLFVGTALLLTLVADSAAYAPIGYEDELGFHYGTPGDRQVT
jgi:hypothetical protein